jgi:serine/threonine protein kinase
MEVVGKGSSGYVRKAFRKSSNEVLALKVINVFEIEKRKQMMQEILMMCDARCDSLIRFHGAFYNEGAISVALEYMTAGPSTAHAPPYPLLSPPSSAVRSAALA